MMQPRVWVSMNQVPFCQCQKSYGFASRLKFGILCPTKKTPNCKSLLETCCIIKIGWKSQRTLFWCICRHISEQQIFEQNWYGFTVILSQIFFVGQNLLFPLQNSRKYLKLLKNSLKTVRDISNRKSILNVSSPTLGYNGIIQV